MGGISCYSKNFVKLMCGTAGAQVIAFITLPILTRMYDVSDFGIQALYMSIVAILSIMVTGRYEMAILLPKADEDSFSLVILALIIALVSCLCIEIIVWFCGGWIVSSIGIEELASWLPFMAFSIFVQVNYNTWYIWLNRNRAYKMMSRMAIITSVFNFLSAFIYGYFTNADGHGLLLNTFSGMLVCSVYMLYYCKKNNLMEFSPNAKSVYKMLCRYKQFPSFLILASVVERGSIQLPFWILNMIGGTYATGLYSMVYKIMQVPVSLVGSAMGNVFVREASESWKKCRSCWNIYFRTIRILTVLGLIPFGILFLVGDSLIPEILGDKWRESSLYIVFLCPMFYLMFISSPLSQVVYIAEKTKMELLMCVMRFWLVLISMMGAYWGYETINAVLIWFGIACCLFYIWQIILTSKWAKGESFFV